MTTLGESPRASLTISYLFPQFPLPTETFAVSDIEALRALGHRVLVHTMKLPRRDEAARLRVSNVPADLPIFRPGIARALGWPALLWRRRRQVLLLARLVARSARRHPEAAAEALLCVPRLLEIADEIVRNRSDVVHAFWSRHAGMVLPVIESLGLPAVRSTFVGAYDLVLDDFLIEIAASSAHAVFSHAEANRPSITPKVPPGTPIHIVHRGIPLPEIEPETGRDNALWITASALKKSKNVEGVLRAFALARSRRPDLRLIVCGDGPDRKRLEQCSVELGCASAVTFRGHIDRQALFRLMQGSATFLLLSKTVSERLPNVVKEALWSGCSVIASRSEGIEELIPDKGIGLVVDPDDERALAAAVEAVLNESEAATQDRRSRARRLIADHFSSERSMMRYVAAWETVGGVEPVASLVGGRP